MDSKHIAQIVVDSTNADSDYIYGPLIPLRESELITIFEYYNSFGITVNDLRKRDVIKLPFELIVEELKILSSEIVLKTTDLYLDFLSYSEEDNYNTPCYSIHVLSKKTKTEYFKFFINPKYLPAEHILDTSSSERFTIPKNLITYLADLDYGCLKTVLSSEKLDYYGTSIPLSDYVFDFEEFK